MLNKWGRTVERRLGPSAAVLVADERRVSLADPTKALDVAHREQRVEQRDDEHQPPVLLSPKMLWRVALAGGV